jgi:excisionase family DNA binding protein
MIPAKLSFESNRDSLLFEKQRLLTVKDVAELLQCSLQHIYNLVWRREIPFVKIGGSSGFGKKNSLSGSIERSSK